MEETKLGIDLQVKFNILLENRSDKIKDSTGIEPQPSICLHQPSAPATSWKKGKFNGLLPQRAYMKQTASDQLILLS